MTVSDVRELDLCGLKCPLPALYTRRALAVMPAGAVLRVHCTDPMAAIDIPHMVHETGCELLASSKSDARLSFDIARGALFHRRGPSDGADQPASGVVPK